MAQGPLSTLRYSIHTSSNAELLYMLLLLLLWSLRMINCVRKRACSLQHQRGQWLLQYRSKVLLLPIQFLVDHNLTRILLLAKTHTHTRQASKSNDFNSSIPSNFLSLKGRGGQLQIRRQLPHRLQDCMQTKILDLVSQRINQAYHAIGAF